MVLFKHQILGGIIMDDKYKKLDALEDEEVGAITGGTKIRTPKKIFNIPRHHGRYRRRLYEKYCPSPEEALKDVPTTLELRPEDYCEKCGGVICGEGCECGEE